MKNKSPPKTTKKPLVFDSDSDVMVDSDIPSAPPRAGTSRRAAAKAPAKYIELSDGDEEGDASMYAD